MGLCGVFVSCGRRQLPAFTALTCISSLEYLELIQTGSLRLFNLNFECALLEGSFKDEQGQNSSCVLFRAFRFCL